MAHPAAVLPMRGLGLPMTAMVVGSMVPDLPLFVRWHQGYEVSHSLLGVVSVDAVASMVIVGVWFVVVRDALVDLAPEVVRRRLPAHVGLTPPAWVLVVPAAWVGALTHVVWDGFTHPGQWGVVRVGWLQAEHAGLPGHRWAQYVSGILGLAVVCIAAVRYLRSQPSDVRREPRPTWATGVLVLAAGAVVVSAVLAAAGRRSAGLHAMAFHGVVTGIVTALVSLAVLTLVWQVTRTRR